jgi:hypothetical protein
MDGGPLAHELAEIGRPLIMPPDDRPLRARASMLRSTSSPPTTSSHVDCAVMRAQLTQPVVGRSLEDEVGAELRHTPPSRTSRSRDAGADRLGHLDAGGAHADAPAWKRPAP